MGRVRVRLFGDAAGQVSVFEDLMVASDTVFFGQIVRNKWAAVGMGFDKNWPENLRATAIVKTGRPHLTGALTMMNLPKTSTAPPLPPRFYIVLGQTQTEETLARFGGEMPKERRKKYLEKGGQPEWDGYATVFGEVVEGMDVLERIAAVPTDKDHRPLRPLPIQFSNH